MKGARGWLCAAALLLGGAAWAAQGEQQAVSAPHQAYEQARQSGQDLSNGPCLGVIQPGWVADIAHQPRQPVDNQPENQCQAYRSGQAKHFVELDPQGNVIKVK